MRTKLVDPDEMPRIAAAYDTISDKVRALHASGYPRSQIAKFLGRHATQVRNVIKNDENRGRRFELRGTEKAAAPRAAEPDPSRVDDAPPVAEPAPGVFHLHLRGDGSVVLPPAVVSAFGFKPGGVVVAHLEGEALVVRSRAENLRRVQEAVRKYVPEGVSLVDELIAERRAAAARGD